MSATGADMRTTGTAHDGNCREAHISLTITSMDGVVRGAHLRRQRQLAGFSIRVLAEAAHLSATRVRQIENAERLTGRAVSRYLDGVVEAWRVRANDTAREESADARVSAPPNAGAALDSGLAQSSALIVAEDLAVQASPPPGPAQA